MINVPITMRESETKLRNVSVVLFKYYCTDRNRPPCPLLSHSGLEYTALENWMSKCYKKYLICNVSN